MWTRWRWRGWHQLYAEDVTLSETLRDAGYTNALVTDVYHQFKPGKNFQRGFQSWRYIRGQEHDALESGPRKAINLSAYVPSRWPEFETYQLEQYLMNRREWKTEEDWPAAQVFREAARWLIAFVADHWTMQGEQGQIGKGEGSLRTQLTHVPLIIYHPFQARAGRRVAGQSLRALMESGERSRRDWIVTGFSDHGAIRTSEWLYIGRWNPGDAWEDLYDVRRDPRELNNVMGDHLDLVKEFRVRLKEYVDSGWGITRGGFTTVLV